MNVFCAIDGSPLSHFAIETLQGLGAGPGSTLNLLHVVDTAALGSWVGMEALELPEERGCAILDRVAKEYVSSGWRAVEKRIVRGRPAEVVLRAAGAMRADLAVVGCRGVTNDPSYLLGSVSRRVVLYAPCAVLVAKQSAPRPRLAVVGMDGSEDARASVEFLLRLPLAREVLVIVATVIPPLPLMGALARGAEGRRNGLQASIEQEAGQAAEEVAAHLRRKGYDATVTIASGQAGAALVALAERSRADLVVVGSRGQTGGRTFLMGSVSETVTTYASCAVLVCRTAPAVADPA